MDATMLYALCSMLDACHTVFVAHFTNIKTKVVIYCVDIKVIELIFSYVVPENSFFFVFVFKFK